jgi:hypothetical protein
MSDYGIKLVAINGALIEPPEWLTVYDPDEGDPNLPYPTGVFESSTSPEHALRFSSFFDATECYKRQSIRTPLRPDGEPNRPLTAFTVQIEQLP